MSESSLRTLFIGGIALAVVVCTAIGWAILERSAPATAPASAGQADQLPTTYQNTGTNSPTPSASVAAVPQTSPTAALPAAEQTATLEDVGRALDAYKKDHQTYPDSLASLRGKYLTTSVDPSYHYGTDTPIDDLYSLCATGSQEYECISSELGSNDPFTFPASSFETSSFSSWQELTFQSTTTGEGNISIARPPGWTYSAGAYEADLNAHDAHGNDVVIGRINLLNWQMRPSETFTEFEKENVAESTARIASTTRTTFSGFPAYILTGTDPESDQTYAFGEYLIQQNDYAFELNIFIDQTISDYFVPAIEYMVGSITVTPAAGT